jgi:uncharacterized protein (TIGR02270 family)
MYQRAPVESVIDQHVEELSILWNTRSLLVEAPAVSLRNLARIDERIDAHEDGCSIAGAYAYAKLAEQLVEAVPERVFAATVVALQDRDRARFDQCVSVACVARELVSGVVAALGWVPDHRLAGIVRVMFADPSPCRRRIALAACRVQGADPGPMLPLAIRDANPGVRTEALRTSAVRGRLDVLPLCAAALNDDDEECRFWAAWSSVLLGNRGVALELLTTAAMSATVHRTRAFGLTLTAMAVEPAHGVLQSLARDSKDLRWLIEGSGIAGDSTYVPWLINHMSNDPTSRLAGEAFSLITGTDIALVDLERKPPEDFESGPNDDPDDPNVDMDPDDGLPWPDPDKVKDWWAKNSGRFQPGRRYFMGQAVTREHCIEVLKNGYQRQRILAAHYLCLLDPGTPLFNTSAPAWRQQKLLATMK